MDLEDYEMLYGYFHNIEFMLVALFVEIAISTFIISGVL